MHKDYYYAKRCGFTLVELAVASCLGLFILSNFLLFFLSVKNTYQMEEGLALMQENGLLVTNLLREDLHHAGFMGCAKWSNLQLRNLSNINAINLDADFALIGYGAGKMQNLPDTIQKQIMSGSNALLITKANHKISYLLQPMQDDTHIQVNAGQHYKKGEILLISDCQQGDLFQIKDFKTTNNTLIITTDTAITHHYSKAAQIASLEAILYFIGKPTQSNPNNYALYRKNLYASTNIPDEIIVGINKFLIYYGVVNADKKNPSIEYQVASQISDWGKVVSVRIEMLLESMEPVVKKEWNFTTSLWQRVHAN